MPDTRSESKTDSNLSHKKNKKIEDLLKVISEARRSLQLWEDKRTEAMIGFDALSYDICFIEEEKNNLREQNEHIKNQLKNNEAGHRILIDEMTESAQLLKLEKDGLERKVSDLLAAQAISEQTQNEQLTKQKKIESEQSRRYLETLGEYEARYSKLEEHYKVQLGELSQQIDSMAAARSKAEQRTLIVERDLQNLLKAKTNSDQRILSLERELFAIRSQVLGAFQKSSGGLNTSAGPAGGLSIDSATSSLDDSPMRSLMAEVASNVDSVVIESEQILGRLDEMPPNGSVQDYLKRLGY